MGEKLDVDAGKFEEQEKQEVRGGAGGVWSLTFLFFFFFFNHPQEQGSLQYSLQCSTMLLAN